MKIEDRNLFLKYALPCIHTLVKRGTVSKNYADNLLENVSNNKTIPKGSEDIFNKELHHIGKENE